VGGRCRGGWQEQRGGGAVVGGVGGKKKLIKCECVGGAVGGVVRWEGR
jgi:hypothetical protein